MNNIMKFILILLAGCLLVSCRTSMPSDIFFNTISTKDIPSMSEKSISYRISYLNTDCIRCGTISEPLFDYNIKYDTLSHYKVVVIGYVVFEKDNYQENQYERIDSVGITRLVISSLHSPRELYSKHGDEHWNDIPWEECSLPKKILKKIRNDFLIRTKYSKYLFNKSELNDELPIKGISTQYCYRLY